MVSILPAERSNFDVIGKAIGQNLSNVLPGAIQQGYQRKQGLNAIDQLQQDLASSGGDLTKMIPAIAKAYTLNPSLERSGIAEKLIPLAQRKAGASEFPAGAGKGGGNTEAPIGVRDLIPPRESMVANPQGVQDFQLPYGPEEISNLRQLSREKNYTPEMEERFVADALEYNKIAANRREYEIQNYEQRQKERRDTIENQNAFEKYLVSHSPEFAENPDDRELALKASEKYQHLPSFAERNAAVKNEIRPYQAAKKALQRNLQRPLTGMTKEQRDLNRPRAQYMVEMGQKPQLQLMIAKGGQGEVEEADLLNPLPEDIETGFRKLPKLVRPLERVTSLDPDSPEYNKQLTRGFELRNKQKNEIVDHLSDVIRPGKDYSHPGTNLLLVRYNIMQNTGADWAETGTMIDDAVSKSKIKLDPQQQIDSQKLGSPPLTGDDYLDTIMNTLMFPITGKQ